MRIGGIVKSSLIDYPGKVAAVIFTQGCNFRCPYCHNPELVNPEHFNKPIPEKEILSFLEMRRGLIDGVVITGGEPLLQPEIKDFIKEVKEMGYSVKLDTNGSNPQRLEELLSEGILDYIAMDIKSPIGKYSSVVRAEVDTDHIRKTLMLITKSGLPYEVRTTLFWGLTMDDVLRMMGELNAFGIENYYLQMAVYKKTYDIKSFDKTLVVDVPMLFENLRENFKQYGFRNLDEKLSAELEADSRGTRC
jgi:pyruvate formate lyase activating enzyme